MPVHIHPTAPLAPRALLPGDPGRALALAQLVLAEPKMFNHNRGLWGYTGEAADGAALTVQSTGMGGPSAAIVVEELILLGARRLVRVGTCGGLSADARLGELVVAEGALATDGASRALGADGALAADAGLVAALQEAAGADGARTGLVATTDLFYDRDRERSQAWRRAGALAIEMEAATVFAVAARHGVAAACVLAISDLELDGERVRIADDALERAEAELGRVGAAALA